MAASDMKIPSDRAPPGFAISSPPRRHENHITTSTNEPPSPNQTPKPLIGHTLAPMPPSLQEIMDAWATYQGKEKSPEMLLDLLRAKSAEENRIIALANLQMIQMQTTMLQIRAAVGGLAASTPPPSTSSPKASGPIHSSRHPEVLAQAGKTPQPVARVLPRDSGSSPSPCGSRAQSQSRSLSRSPSLGSPTPPAHPVSRSSDDDERYMRASSSRRVMAAPYPPRIPIIPPMKRSPPPPPEVEYSPPPSSSRSTRKRVSLSPPPLASQGASAVNSNNPAYILSRKPLAQLVSTPSKSSALYASSRRRPTPAEEQAESLSSS
ncbi:hypothetical protein DL93DRAFT_2093567 [Clavulina sp. PMI_390]|nr:hypothetical protein DL93DRAFT_2093567 [Clavulina sp. PMI_390]